LRVKNAIKKGAKSVIMKGGHNRKFMKIRGQKYNLAKYLNTYNTDNISD
jgi:hydroxymethylpyrimidine/phosphomethylpyrimidine kinase